MRTFDDYRKDLECVRSMTQERILEQASTDKNIEFPDFIRLCKLANPEVC